MISRDKNLILVVDDIHENLMLISAFLKRLNYNIITASNGKEAMKVVEIQKPDLMILDLMMPVMNGFEVCAAMKENEEYSQIPIIISSALDDSEDIIKAYELGAVDYLTKPIVLDILKMRLEIHLKLRTEINARKEAEEALKIERDSLKEKVEEQVIDLKEALKKAKVAVQAKDNFLSNMSHEIRTPMNGIIGMSEMLATTNQTELQKKYNNTILYSSRALLIIINDILDFAKIEAGELDIIKTPFNITEVLNDIYLLFEVQLLDKNLELIIDYKKDFTHIFIGDPRRIRQVLINLIGNAIKFTPQGHVKVSLEYEPKENGLVELSINVSDTGIGMSQEESKAIFDRFKQVDDSISRKFGGSGLGLTISKEIMRLMNGSLELVSTNKNQGSEFLIKLELKLASKEEMTLEVQEDKELLSLLKSKDFKTRLRALVVDDSYANRNILELILNYYDVEVDSAENGKEAVDMIKIKKYDIVFMDCMMPIMNGYEATINIRKKEKINKEKPITIIALTGAAMAEDKKKCIDAGMTEYLTKPVASNAIEDILIRYCKLKTAIIKRESRHGIYDESFEDTQLVDKKHIDEFDEFNEEQIQQLLTLERTTNNSMITLFEEDVNQDIKLLEKSIEEKNIDNIRLHAHSLKGSLGNLGGKGISKLAKQIQMHAEDENKIKSLFKTLINKLEDLYVNINKLK